DKLEDSRFAVAQQAGVGERIERQVLRHCLIDRYAAARKGAASRGQRGDSRDICGAGRLADGLIVPKQESAALDCGAASGCAKLIPPEGRRRRAIEEITGV